MINSVFVIDVLVVDASKLDNAVTVAAIHQWRRDAVVVSQHAFRPTVYIVNTVFHLRWHY